MLTYKRGQDGDSPQNNREGAHLECPQSTAHAYSVSGSCLEAERCTLAVRSNKCLEWLSGLDAFQPRVSLRASGA